MYHLSEKEKAQADRMLQRVHKLMNNKPVAPSVAALVSVMAELCLLGANGDVEAARERATAFGVDVANHIGQVAQDIVKRSMIQ